MNTLMISKGLSAAGKTFIKYSPQILTAAGCAGVILTGVLTAKAAIESSEILKYKKEEKKELFVRDMLQSGKYEKENDIPDELIKEASKLKAGEVVALTWKKWIGPISSGLATIGCNIGSERSSSMKNAALLTAYNATANEFKEYKIGRAHV